MRLKMFSDFIRHGVLHRENIADIFFRFVGFFDLPGFNAYQLRCDANFAARQLVI